MTEAEWLACSELRLLLITLAGGPEWGNRYALAAAFLRHIRQLMPEGACRRHADVAERYAEGTASREEMRAAEEWARDALDRFDSRGTHPWACPDSRATHAVFTFFRWIDHEGMPAGVAHSARWALTVAVCDAAVTLGILQPSGGVMEMQVACLTAEEEYQCDVTRDLFNPFHTARFDPAWRTPAVASVAKAIYDERNCASLPILADALEDAGCTDATLLMHCREPRQHGRGCWAVDLVRGT